MNRYEWLEEYLIAKKGCVKDYKEEWGWTRYQVGGKMFAATCCPGEQHGEYAGHELLTLKCDPMLSELLREQHPEIRPGFYMDKRNWISIFLEGQLPEETLRALCDSSYALVFGKLTKKMQRQIEDDGKTL